ncbi:CDP-diacylglycerol--serine O-phosphatidyltransferase [Vulgatibacter incomptus]|uniref:CDP-diacylglycerol--serine O-phosphatidyltransferase n=1 Tax=Vulgatibacter incomptus TaxID=1391653 RepID=A0A0K1PEF5_9BACT|nr:CDP-diacylglycerol--serine O-phosphatidyltransferase [Vulgatibacter incomptus]
MRPRKWLYILPNLFTLSSVFCGLYAMSLVAGEPSAEKLYAAALAILFGMLFDGLDGRVARLTKTQSDFGMQLDSLADVVTFGAAPALLVWKWALAPLGFVGLFLAFAFAACGALRLARFNVLEMRGSKGSSTFFVGLPIPLAAGVLVSLVIAHYKGFGGDEVPVLPVAVLVALLSYLMVSTVRYRTFKKMNLSRKTAGISAFFATSAVALTLQYRASFTLLVFGTLYVCAGIAEEVIFFRRRRDERLLARAAADGRSTIVDEDEESPEDE